MGWILHIRQWRLWLSLLGGLMSAAPVLAGPSPFPDRPVLIFVIAGQSNATGLAPINDLGDLTPFRRDDVLNWRGSDGWQPLQPGQGNSPTTFGPELTLGAALADAFPTHQVALVKHAPPGSGLAGEWQPDGFAFRGLATEVGEVVASLEAFAIDFQFAGTFWIQGERDAHDEQAGSDYEQNLLGLMSDLRDMTGADPFTIARISSRLAIPPHAFKDLVRAAQEDVTGADPLAALVNADDLPLQDGTHYSAQAYLTLGERLAQAHLSLVSVPELSAFAYVVLALVALATFSRAAPGGRRQS